MIRVFQPDAACAMGPRQAFVDFRIQSLRSRKLLPEPKDGDERDSVSETGSNLGRCPRPDAEA
eukprot:1146482-Rhodomonas_salina.5